MKAPAWFERELRAFDEDLRLRWSVKKELWLIERRVRRALHPGTIKTDLEDDDSIRARDGYLLVASIPPRGLSRFVFQKLRESDLWQTGWKRVADELEAAEQAAEQKAWSDFSADVAGLSDEVYSFIARREGRQVFSLGFPE